MAAKTASISQGIQAVLMPVIFMQDNTTMTSRAAYSGTSFRGNSTVSLKIFTNANGANPITDALTWAVNPFASGAPNSTVNTTMADVVSNITLP